jgi:lysophospholipase L1-like esterase
LTGAGGGVVTQGAVDIAYGDFTQSGWTWTGNTGKTQTCSGNWASTSTNSNVKLITTADGKTISNTGGSFNSLRASSNVSYSGAGNTAVGLAVDSGKMLTLASGTFTHSYYGGCTYSNPGTIDGAGTLLFMLYDADMTIGFGAINCPVTVRAHPSSTANRVLTQSANASLGSTLILLSSHATYTATLATSTYTLTCGALTLDTRGCLSQTGTSGNVTCSSYTQSGTGSVLTGNVDATFTCGGNFNKTAGTLSVCVLCLIMSGVGSSLSLDDNPAYIGRLTVTNSTVIKTNIYLGAGIQAGYINSTGAMRVYTGKTVTIGANPSIGQIVVDGSIDGPGTLVVNCTDNKGVYSNIVSGIGIIRAPIQVSVESGVASANTIYRLAKDFLIGGTITVKSYDAAKTITLDAYGYNLSANGNIYSTVVCLGDSITLGTGGTPYPTQMVSLIPNRILNKGVGGDTVSQMIARFNADVVAQGANTVVILGGINDVMNTGTAVQVEADLATLYAAALAANIKVLACTITPDNNANSTQNAMIAAVNAWIKTQASSNVTVLELAPLIADPQNPTNILPAYNSDGVHLTTAGYSVFAQAVANSLPGGGFYSSPITASTRGIITSSVPGAVVNALGGITVAANGAADLTNVSLLDATGSNIAVAAGGSLIIGKDTEVKCANLDPTGSTKNYGAVRCTGAVALIPGTTKLVNTGTIYGDVNISTNKPTSDIDLGKVVGDVLVTPAAGQAADHTLNLVIGACADAVTVEPSSAFDIDLELEKNLLVDTMTVGKAGVGLGTATVKSTSTNGKIYARSGVTVLANGANTAVVVDV